MRSYGVHVVYAHNPGVAVSCGTWYDIGHACVGLKTGGNQHSRRERTWNVIEMRVRVLDSGWREEVFYNDGLRIRSLERYENVLESYTLSSREMRAIARDWRSEHPRS